MNRYLTLSAILHQFLGTPVMFLSTLFGSIVSFICWIAIGDGAPHGFLLGPAFFFALVIIAFMRSLSKISLLKYGILTKGTVTKVSALNVYSNRRQVFTLVVQFFDSSGSPHKIIERATEPKYDTRSPLPCEGDKIDVLFHPTRASRAQRLDKLQSGALRISDKRVDASMPGLFFLAIPPLIFTLVNLRGVLNILI